MYFTRELEQGEELGLQAFQSGMWRSQVESYLLCQIHVLFGVVLNVLVSVSVLMSQLCDFHEPLNASASAFGGLCDFRGS